MKGIAGHHPRPSKHDKRRRRKTAYRKLEKVYRSEILKARIEMLQEPPKGT